MARAVAAADPHDVNAKDAVARAHLSIGQVLQNAGRLNESIEYFAHALQIASDRYAADPTNGVAAERLANISAALAGSYAGLASAATDPIDAMRRWREARVSSRKSLDTWTERRAKGPLSSISQNELDSLSELIAKSDREVARLAARAKK